MTRSVSQEERRFRSESNACLSRRPAAAHRRAAPPNSLRSIASSTSATADAESTPDRRVHDVVDVAVERPRFRQRRERLDEHRSLPRRPGPVGDGMKQSVRHDSAEQRGNRPKRDGAGRATAYFDPQRPQRRARLVHRIRGVLGHGPRVRNQKWPRHRGGRSSRFVESLSDQRSASPARTSISSSPSPRSTITKSPARTRLRAASAPAACAPPDKAA